MIRLVRINLSGQRLTVLVDLCYFLFVWPNIRSRIEYELIGRFFVFFLTLATFTIWKLIVGTAWPVWRGLIMHTVRFAKNSVMLPIGRGWSTPVFAVVSMYHFWLLISSTSLSIFLIWSSMIELAHLLEKRASRCCNLILSSSHLSCSLVW